MEADAYFGQVIFCYSSQKHLIDTESAGSVGYHITLTLFMVNTGFSVCWSALSCWRIVDAWWLLMNRIATGYKVLPQDAGTVM